MAFNIIETVRGYLTPDLLQRTGNQLGESESGISKALSGLVPAVFGGLISKATSGRTGAEQVLGMARDNYSSGFPGNLLGGDLFSRGAGLLQGLFGDKLSGIVNSIASFAGIKTGSVNSLLGMAAPLSLGALGKHASENNLDADGLTGFLRSQKDSVAAALPGGLSGMLGLGNLGGLGSSLSNAGRDIRETATEATAYAATSQPRRTAWLPWLLLLAGVIALLWWLLGRNKTDADGMANTDTTTNTAATAPTTPATDTGNTSSLTVTRESTKVRLPNGTELDAYRGGIEDQLVAFLSTDWKALGNDSLKNRWFDFDDLNFRTASSQLTPESGKQVANIAAILKAFPEAKLKIGGYTDRTGSEPANKTLSANRAKAVHEALKAAGVGGQVTGAEGYGSSFARYPADAPESDRVKDRRVGVSVRS